MKIMSYCGRYALGVCASAAILAGCNSAGSPSSFAPGSPKQSASERTARPDGGVTHYYRVNLGTLGGKYSSAYSINNRGWIAGGANTKTQYHPALWRAGRKADLGTLGGPAAAVGYPVKNTRGLLVGDSLTSKTDPYAENFCLFNNTPPDLCLGFRWQNGVMTALPTLGGNNGWASAANNAGQIVGWAENTTQDPSCESPQVLDFYGVIWQRNGTTVTLPPYSGDTISIALAVNDGGNVVGYSGACAPTDKAVSAEHALLWQAGSPIDLGSLGGDYNRVPFAITNRGQSAGYADLPGDTYYHAFYWENGVMSDLGTLPGDSYSVAFGMNDKGQIVGQSCDAKFTCVGFIWQGGSMTDLNDLIPRNPAFYVAYASDINDRGQIAAVTYNPKNGEYRAVALIPGNDAFVRAGSHAPKITLPETLRNQVGRIAGARRPFVTP